MVKNIYESNERQINIINDLLKVAQVDAGQVQLMKKKIDLVELIHDIINEQQHKFKSRSQVVKFNHHVDQAWSVVDRNRMRMALENIIDNASKYTPEHKQISVIATDSTNAVTIEVKDEGVGIPQDEIELIFEKFIRLDNPLSMAVGGTGLGLYWVKKIIDLHGATLEVQSKPSTGTSFIITIPRLPEDM